LLILWSTTCNLQEAPRIGALIIANIMEPDADAA